MKRVPMHAALRTAVPAITLAAVAACGDGAARQQERSPLLLTESAVADTVETHLIALQRVFIGAVQQPDSVALGALMAADFRAYDTRSSDTSAISLGPRDRPVELSYLEVLAGSLAVATDGRFDSFHVTYDAGQAIVYATGMHRALRTVWRRTSTGWRAAQLIVLSPGAAQRMIAGQ